MERKSLHVLLLCLFLRGTDGKYFHILKTCQFIETESQCDVHYQIRYQYKGRLQALYNSSTEKVDGFTEYGKMFAEEVNKDSHYLQVRRNDLNYFCKTQAAHAYKEIKTKAVPPVSNLKLVGSGSIGDSVLLVCSAYNFYPRQIRLSWLKDGVVLPDHADVVITEMPSGAWRYQSHSYLKHRLTTGRNISCMVEHTGLREPQLLQLEQSEVQNDWLLPLGGTLLGLGITVLLLSIGFCWRKTC